MEQLKLENLEQQETILKIIIIKILINGGVHIKCKKQ